jgi:hypothetical protein
MKRLVVAAVVLAFAGLTARAEDKPNPTGTWRWKVNIGGEESERVLKLKLEGDKLSGTITGRDNTESKIEDPKYKDGEVTFKVTREFNGNKFVLHYSAKVSGDTLKGKTEIERDGEKQSREFEAKRDKEKKDR